MASIENIHADLDESMDIRSQLELSIDEYREGRDTESTGIRGSTFKSGRTDSR